MIGITGTNGKSTVTTLVGEMCKRYRAAHLRGRQPGHAARRMWSAPRPRSRAATWWWSCRAFSSNASSACACNVGALLNVTDDHLDRYPSFEAYAAAKANIFRGQHKGDVAVLPAGDALCRRLAEHGAADVHEFGGDSGSVRVIDGVITDIATGPLLPVRQLRIKGQHNIDNACAAALCARLAGVPWRHIAAVLASFPGLPHRMVHVADVDGVLTRLPRSTASRDSLGMLKKWRVRAVSAG